MTSGASVKAGDHSVAIVSDRLTSDLSATTAQLYGSATPRISTPINDLPSRGGELIDFADQLFPDGFMPWQKYVAEHAHKVKPDGRWASPLVCTVVARQSGKSTLMQARILMGLFHWNEPLQIASAHRLQTSLEQFRQMVSLIEANDDLSKQIKKIRWSHGGEEIETIGGNRFMIKAGGAAARGVSRPESINLDELREMNELESFASLRYTLLAAKNPQIFAFSNAGDSHSLVLNGLKARGHAAIDGANDDLAYFEWSAPNDDIYLESNWQAANPALGHTIHIDNIKSTLNDPPEVIMTEVLCRWVTTINSCVGAAEWERAKDDTIDLDTEKLTWLALDISPDRKHCALVAAQKLGDERFIVKLLHTWTNTQQLDDRAIANDAAKYCRQYPMQYLLYSRRTSGAVAARLQPAGIPIYDMDSDYPQACDEWLSAINSGRLVHRGQDELTVQMLSAVQLRKGDGGWVIGRRASQAAVCAAVATALVTHFATRPETEIDILVG